MATSTYMTFLMHKKETTWEKLLDITEFPDLGGDPELLETTTLSDKMQTYVNGVQSNDGMTFNANYDHTEYKALKALEGKNEEYAVWFGGTETASSPTPTGSEGKFKFAGELFGFFPEYLVKIAQTVCDDIIGILALGVHVLLIDRRAFGLFCGGFRQFFDFTE